MRCPSRSQPSGAGRSAGLSPAVCLIPCCTGTSASMLVSECVTRPRRLRRRLRFCRCSSEANLDAAPCVEVMVRSLRFYPAGAVRAHHCPHRFRCSLQRLGAASGLCCRLTWCTPSAWIWPGKSAVEAMELQQWRSLTSSRLTTWPSHRLASKVQMRRAGRRLGAFAALGLPPALLTNAACNAALLGQGKREREAKGGVAHLERTLGCRPAPGERADWLGRVTSDERLSRRSTVVRRSYRTM